MKRADFGTHVRPPSRQFSLDLRPQPKLGRGDFCVSPANSAALDMLDLWPHWPGKTLLLCGPEGSGKSHLACIWADVASAQIQPAATLHTANLAQLAKCGAAIVEDADRPPCDEAQLFHLLNLMHQSGGWLLLTARQPPDLWGLQTPDLLSRLRLAPCLQLLVPDDALIRKVLAKHLADRQIAVDAGVLDYVVVRMERSMAAAQMIAAALDEEALRQAQPVTRRLAGDVLARLYGAQGEIDYG